MAEHAWSFFRAGGVDQVILKTGDDIEALKSLDKKLWVALACPTKGTEIDEKTLALLDTDSDGRLRPPEILAAIEWAGAAFKSLDPFFEKGSTVALSSLDETTDEGKAVLASAKRILKDQDKKDAKSIALEDVTAMQEVFAKTRFNGDGIVPVDSSDDEATQKVIGDIIEVRGPVTDRSGKPGVDKAGVEGFFDEAGKLLAWDDEGQAEIVRSLGDDTAAAATALTDVEAKIEDWFARCRVAAFDARGATMLAPTEAELGALSHKTLVRADEDVAKLPLAKIEASAVLPLGAGLNPAWAGKVAAFVEKALKPVVGAKSSLNEADFGAVQSKLAAYRGWLAKKPITTIEKLGVARVREIVGSDAKDAILKLIEKDLALEAEYAKITLVEKAVRLRRDLVQLLSNFVNFGDFYGRKKGTFQAGTLFLDGRSCDLCIRVNDAGKHAALAALSKAYLAYCDCTRAGEEKMQIVAAFTAGDVDNLMVGRNGVFYDRKGNDWDATITTLVEAPISVRQAFWSPYKRLIRLIEEQVAKRAADKEKESSGHIDAAAAAAGSADKTAVPPPPPPGAPPPAAAPGAPAPGAAPEEKGVDVGTVAAIGVAVAGVATFVSTLLAAFFGLGMWMPLGVIALMLAISGPSMLIAWLKLRQRNLGPILDANGWAVNAMVKINVPFGGSLTKVRELPEGASRSASDPFAEKPTPWGLYIFLFVVLGLGVAWTLGKLDGFLPEKARAASVLHPKPAASGSAAPAAGSAAPAAPPASAAPAAK